MILTLTTTDLDGALPGESWIMDPYLELQPKQDRSEARSPYCSHGALHPLGVVPKEVTLRSHTRGNDVYAGESLLRGYVGYACTGGPFICLPLWWQANHYYA